MRLPDILIPLCLAVFLAVSAASADPASGPPADPASLGEPSAGDGGSVWMDDDPLFGEGDDYGDDYGGRDPFEGANRNVFAFNRSCDRWIFDPVTRAYRYAVPEAGRRAIYRASLNLDSPVELANHMLQFRVVDATGTATRFFLNSTLGVAGFFDPAADFFEVARVDADFGQTLARYGSPSGPYLMLPVFGPSTVRDVFGDVVDILADPLTFLLGPFQWWTLALGGSEGLVVREANFDDLKNLEAGSIDFYAALRSAYLQSREARVREAVGSSEPADIVMGAIQGEPGPLP